MPQFIRYPIQIQMLILDHLGIFLYHANTISSFLTIEYHGTKICGQRYFKQF